MTEPFKVIIPARYASTRLPGKPLIPICGRPMLHHVIERVLASGASEAVVATDDQRIVDACAGMAAQVLLTSDRHRSGSERAAEVVERLNWSANTIVVLVQGDEPAVAPQLIAQVGHDLAEHADATVATPVTPITRREDIFDSNVVKALADKNGYALYFSRAPVPWYRDTFSLPEPSLPAQDSHLRHIGMYAYRAGFLPQYAKMPPAPLEMAESLEQLRILWHGLKIHLCMAQESSGPGVDIPEDIQKVEAFLNANC